VIDEVTLEMVLLQLIPFLITVFGLHAIIFKPMLAHLAERERHIDGFKGEANNLQDDVAAKVAELEAKLTEARRESLAERNKLRLESKVAEAEMLASARARAEVIIGDAREALAGDRDAASKQLQATARGLSSSIASTILGRTVEGN